jgi:hypothetical protein
VFIKPFPVSVVDGVETVDGDRLMGKAVFFVAALPDVGFYDKHESHANIPSDAVKHTKRCKQQIKRWAL